jgi:hypothetical protein
MLNARKRARERGKSSKKPRRDAADDVADADVAFHDEEDVAGAAEAADEEPEDTETAAEKRLRLGKSTFLAPKMLRVARCLRL